ncbi:MAG: YdaS family helix-turn-helix protein [Gammaproteobacteria bacterium]
MSPIEKACSEVGGQVRMAEFTGVTVQAVNQWVSSGRVPALRCIAVESACNAAVTRHELRPDIFGPALAKAAA